MQNIMTIKFSILDIFYINIDNGKTSVFKRIYEYICIFKNFPPNADICIQIMVILNAEYYLNMNISEYWSLKIRGNTGIKEVLFSFFT